jgi:hypothetical protein
MGFWSRWRERNFVEDWGRVRQMSDRLAEADLPDKKAEQLRGRAESLIEGGKLPASALLAEAAEFLAMRSGQGRSEKRPSDEVAQVAVEGAVIRGFAVRAVETAAGESSPPPETVAARLRQATALGTGRADAAITLAYGIKEVEPYGQQVDPPAGGLFGHGAETWGWLQFWARQRGLADCRARFGAPPAVDYEGAFLFGYVIRSCEEFLQAADLPARTTTHPPTTGRDRVQATAPTIDLGDLLERAASIYGSRRDEIWELPDTGIALGMGLTHLGIDGEAKEIKRAMVSAARMGYAFRRAEEEMGISPGAERNVFEWLSVAEAQRPDAPHWEAMQAAAWGITRATRMQPAGITHDDQPLTWDYLPGHTKRDIALEESAGDILLAVVGAQNVHRWLSKATEAARFGYTVRFAEASLPDDPSRLLEEG